MQYYSFLILLVCVYDGLTQGVGNPDDTSKIERPCPTFDINCIRDYFVKHSHCKKAFGPAPDPYIRRQTANYVPRVNMSLNLLDENVGGLNGRIEDFYINNNTDKLVIAVEFRPLHIYSNRTFFRFHRRAKEPVVTFAKVIDVILGSVVITGVIPQIDDLRLDRSVHTAFVNDIYPIRMIIDPNAANSTDPQPAIAVAQLLANIPVAAQEVFLTDASFYLTTYIQCNICDFGLNVL